MEVKPKKKFYKKWWFWVIAVVIIAGAIGGGGSKEDTNTSKDTSSKAASTDTKKEAPKKEEVKKEEPKAEDTKVTYDNFLKIKMGMKYADVAKILGEGTQESSSEVSGIKTVMYKWNGKGLGNMNITIQNGMVTGRAQAWLDEIYSEVTLDKYNKVKEGMTYDQVKAVLGEGQLSSQTKIMDMESTMYSWINKDGSNMNCTFSGNKMDMKAQFNLK